MNCGEAETAWPAIRRFDKMSRRASSHLFGSAWTERFPSHNLTASTISDRRLSGTVTMNALQVAACVFVCCAWSFSAVAARGAGRAFPIASENFVIDAFEAINPNIEWDETNFLVDLAGLYANCKATRLPSGIIQVDRKARDGSPLVGVVDSIAGGQVDSRSTAEYIEQIVRRWINSSQLYLTEIRRSTKFGCSVRPGCDGRCVVACLFGKERPKQGKPIQETPPPPRPTLPPRTTTTRRPPPPTVAPSTPERIVERTPRPTLSGRQRALAFTPEQYKVIEGILGRSWDQSHYMENLSGYETDCSMVDTASWPFDHTRDFSEQLSLNLHGFYGYAKNVGSTPDALSKILPRLKQVVERSPIHDLGCSLIPDCVNDRTQEMYVVVACLYDLADNTRIE